MKIKASVDRSLTLVIHRSSIYWKTHTQERPADGVFFYVDGSPVRSSWNEEDSRFVSSDYIMPKAFLQPITQDMSYERLHGNLSVKISEQPCAENDYKLVFEFRGPSKGRTAEQEIQINWPGSWLPDIPKPKQGLHVRAKIDGNSRLVIRGNTVFWRHLRYSRPGFHSGQGLPTYLNGRPWRPHWPKQDKESSNKPWQSSVYDSLRPSLPREEVDVSIEVLEGRSKVKILQQPKKENDYTLVVDFYDHQASSAWYDVLIEW